KAGLAEKQNRLIAACKGEIIVFWDDDDYYAPDYVTTMVRYLTHYDFVTLSGWYTYAFESGLFGYWDTHVVEDRHYMASGEKQLKMVKIDAYLKNNLWGYGFCHAFYRRLALETPIPDWPFAPDYAFFLKIQDQCRCYAFQDTQGICLHFVHRYNMSRCFPQYRLPSHTLPRLFTPEAHPVLPRYFEAVQQPMRYTNHYIEAMRRKAQASSPV
ncbi:MAG: glycosyltransferase, partial [Cyanobacteria bacterium HKST-UBA05]|nr:glycosyltransferase [Cyanobacteria bacterium HKST-UBA05]